VVVFEKFSPEGGRGKAEQGFGEICAVVGKGGRSSWLTGQGVLDLTGGRGDGRSLQSENAGVFKSFPFSEASRR
jgi:hypothetical protein